LIDCWRTLIAVGFEHRLLRDEPRLGGGLNPLLSVRE
jgi:hypothetical protein